MDKTKIIIVDDHAIVRDGLKAILSFFKELEVIGTAESYQALLPLLDKQIPDVMLLDIEIPEMDGLEIASTIQEKYPDVRKLILSAHITGDNISRAVDAGVMAILPKDSSEDELKKAIDKAILGEHYYSNYVSDIILKNYLKKDKISTKYEVVPPAELSDREIEIIQAFSDGLSYKEIGVRLNISPRTVESHKNRIFDKLQLPTIIDLVKYGIKNNLINY